MSGYVGRWMRGRKNHNATLTEDKVREIRRWRALGRTPKQIAVHVGCTETNVNAVLYKGNWGWVK